MKKLWSSKWIGSVQPRKQRKYRYNAPLHVKRKFISAHLSKELRERFGRRAITVRKGDEVTVMKGEFKGFRGNVDKVNISKTRIYVDGMKRKKVDGSEISVSIHPSNVMITKLSLEDKMRQAVFERSGRKSSKPSSDGEKRKEEDKPAKAQKSKAAKEKAKPEPKKGSGMKSEKRIGDRQPDTERRRQETPSVKDSDKPSSPSTEASPSKKEEGAEQKAEHERPHHKEKDW